MTRLGFTTIETKCTRCGDNVPPGAQVNVDHFGTVKIWCQSGGCVERASRRGWPGEKTPLKLEGLDTSIYRKDRLDSALTAMLWGVKVSDEF